MGQSVYQPPCVGCGRSLQPTRHHLQLLQMSPVWRAFILPLLTLRSYKAQALRR